LPWPGILLAAPGRVGDPALGVGEVPEMR